jgi:hypothetical protein
MSPVRLEGLEPDNLLAFLALLGLLRALEAADREQGDPNDAPSPRAAWDVDVPPLRPTLLVAQGVTHDDIAGCAARGLKVLAAAHQFAGRRDLSYPRAECRTLLKEVTTASRIDERGRADLLAGLMTDGAVKDDKTQIVDPTPLCLLFGQGHQHFLERLAIVPGETEPPSLGKRKTAVMPSSSECLSEALFQPWHRRDSTFSFRWDPEEDVRYALMAGDPTDPAYKGGTQHGANRLAAVGLAALTVVPITRGGRVRPSVIGGVSGPTGFSFAWPIWREPVTLVTIRTLLSHPALREPGGLTHLGVDHVVITRRLSVGKFMNFSRARPITEGRTPRPRW